MYRWVLVLLVACACPSKQAVVPQTGSGTSTTVTPPAQAATCDGARPHVEELYRAEAQQREPNRVDEAVADNTHMAMNDCAKAPTKVAACLAKAASVAQLEKECLIPLDDEGTEGRR